MRGRSLLDSTPEAEGSTALPVKEVAPSENRAGGFWTWKVGEVLMQGEIQHSEWVRRRLTNVAVSFSAWALPWPGVPP